MRKRLLAAVVLGGALSSGCFDLDVPTLQPVAGQTYTRPEILANPVLLERIVAGTFVLFWAEVRGESPWVNLSIFGEEFTSSITTFTDDIWEIVKENPSDGGRGEIPNFLGVTHNMMRDPWHLFYESNSSAAEFGAYIKENNIRIVDPVTLQDNTQRLLAFAKFVMGMSHVQIGLLFDSAAIVNEAVDLTKPANLPLRPYQEVLDSGIKWLQEAADISDANSFTMPLNEGQWIFGSGFDNQRLASAAHAYIARAMVYGARTPAERLAVDWAKVKTHIARAPIDGFGPRGQPASGGGFLYRAAATQSPNNNSGVCNNECNGSGNMRVDMRLVGPADVSGSYQTWLSKVADTQFDTVAPVSVITPDQRIQEIGGILPNIKPAYFKYYPDHAPVTQHETVIRGVYYQSHYWNSTRALNNGDQFPATGGGRNESDDLRLIQDHMLLGVEMDLLLAEAHIRGTPQNLPAAVELINKSRVINGELPDVTVNGVPVAADCVPKRYDGMCGTLWDALVYEKRLETYGTGIAFFDLRGWGCLIQGTAMQFAPPASQLDVMGKVIYTYGGTRGLGPLDGAPKPTPENCPLLYGNPPASP